VERLRSVFEAPRQLNLSLKMPIPLICTSGPQPTFQSFHFRFKVPIMVFLTIIFTSFLHSLIRVTRRDKIWDFKRILIQTHNFSMKKPSTRCTDTLDQWRFTRCRNNALAVTRLPKCARHTPKRFSNRLKAFEW